MKFDFTNPRFVGGQLTFPEKEQVLIDIFRRAAFRLKYVLKPNMVLSKDNQDIALVKNWGYSLELVMKDGSTPIRRFLRNRQDISRFFENREKSAVREALNILRKSGYKIIVD